MARTVVIISSPPVGAILVIALSLIFDFTIDSISIVRRDIRANNRVDVWTGIWVDIRVDIRAGIWANTRFAPTGGNAGGVVSWSSVMRSVNGLSGYEMRHIHSHKPNITDTWHLSIPIIRHGTGMI